MTERLTSSLLRQEGPQQEDWKALFEQAEDMLLRVEWVRQSAGNKYACPFCKCISDRDDGPGHAEDCEWSALVVGRRETSVLQAVLDAIKGALDPHTQIADHPNVKFAQMQRLNLVAEIEQWKCNSRENKLIAEENSRRADAAERDLAAAQARIEVLEGSIDYLRNVIDHPVRQEKTTTKI